MLVAYSDVNTVSYTISIPATKLRIVSCHSQKSRIVISLVRLSCMYGFLCDLSLVYI